MLPRRSSHDSPRPLRWTVGVSISLVAIASLPLSALWQRSYAQSFTVQEITNYAAAVLAMEEIRSEAYGEISDIFISNGDDVTNFAIGF